MNPPPSAELDQLADRLHRLRAALDGQLRRHLAQAPAWLAAALLEHRAMLDDSGVARQLRGCDMVLLAEELTALRRIEGACARLAAGTYGRCVSCGGPVAPERLRVQPAALTCLACQEDFERHPHRRLPLPQPPMTRRKQTMSYKTILVQADKSQPAARAIEMAAQLAVAFEAHLVGVASSGINRFIQQSSLFPPGAPGMPIEVGDLGFLRERAGLALGDFAAAAGRLGVQSHEKRCVDDELDVGLALHARYADLVVVGQADPDHAGATPAPGLAQQVMLHAPRPVLVTPHSGRMARIGHKVMVAWDGSLEATRAVTAAIPLLQRAAKVTLAIFNPYAPHQAHGEQPGADLALYLARHGITVEVERRDTPFDVGNELLTLASDIDADLMVMGGYGHTRFREVALGGVTRTILGAMTLPVLMAH
ncbi:universal stress protein [Duganella hordei]|uniref:universal stress protein n=1 Tax=Duganella hordei TaxID=2865934 RepID=UPI0030EB03E0